MGVGISGIANKGQGNTSKKLISQQNFILAQLWKSDGGNKHHDFPQKLLALEKI